MSDFEKINIMFWNCHKKDCDPRVLDSIIEIFATKSIHLLFLSESTSEPADVVDHISAKIPDFIHIGGTKPQRIEVYTTLPSAIIKFRIASKRYVIVELTQYGKTIEIVGLHLLSKVGVSQLTQVYDGEILLKEIKAKLKSDIHVLLGDFNCNPYEPLMLSTTTFNTIFPCQHQQTVFRRGFKTNSHYINPSWGLFKGNSAPGTFRHTKSPSVDNVDWNILDQAIFSSDAFEYYCADSLEIVERVPGHDFVGTDGEINTTEYSDHLPIMFTLAEGN